MEQNKTNKTEITVVRFSALGDVAMCIPVLYSACSSNPEINFTFVTNKAYTSVLINRPANLTVIGADLRGTHKGFAGMRRLAEELGKPKIFIDLHSVIRTHILSTFMRLKGVRVLTIDKGRKHKRKLIKSGATIATPLKTTFTRYAEPFFNVPLRLDNRFDGLFANNPAEVSLFASITPPKAKGERWIGIAPFAAHQGKIYPLDKMKVVFDELAGRSNTKIFLFGGGAIETQTLTEWAFAHNNVVCVAGKKLGFAGELALMNSLDFMLCMDSGNMHLAAIAGTRTLSIWGATHPAAGFTPWRTTFNDRIELSMDCRPCSIFGNKPCKFGTFACMNAIKPEDIIKHINEAYS
jgi:ADP-heptose:LPS heptosyltransferase